MSKYRHEPYFVLNKVLGFYPSNIEYYELALRHSSATLPTESGQLLSNERLEFLGDAVLNSVVSEILYKKYENEREGFLTNTRSKLVKRDSLNQLAIDIGLDKLIIKSKHINNQTNYNIFGNALEALIGAIYLDYGYNKCIQFVEKRLLKNFIDLDKLASDEVNFKSKLLEICQKNKIEPEFVLISETQDNKNRHVFLTQLTINGKIICESSAGSKKESHQNVSLIALQKFENTPGLLDEIINSSTIIV